jgi:hypothetical protein
VRNTPRTSMGDAELSVLESPIFNDPLGVILQDFLSGKDILSLSETSKTMRATITSGDHAAALSEKFVFRSPPRKPVWRVGVTGPVSKHTFDDGKDSPVAVCAAKAWKFCITTARAHSVKDLRIFAHLEKLSSIDISSDRAWPSLVCRGDSASSGLVIFHSPFKPTSEAEVKKNPHLEAALRIIARLPWLRHVKFTGDGAQTHLGFLSILGYPSRNDPIGAEAKDFVVEVTGRFDPNVSIPPAMRMTHLIIAPTRDNATSYRGGNKISAGTTYCLGKAWSLRKIHLSGTLDADGAEQIIRCRSLTHIDLTRCFVDSSCLSVFLNSARAGITIHLSGRACDTVPDDVEDVLLVIDKLRLAGIVVHHRMVEPWWVRMKRQEEMSNATPFVMDMACLEL